MEYTREVLIDLCERSIVPVDQWSDRDSAQCMIQLGSCLALLKCGCDFKVLYEDVLCTNEETIWVEIEYPGFAAFEGFNSTKSNFWLPTEKRLRDNQGRDWY